MDQKLLQLAERLAAVAVEILFFAGDFSKRLVQRRKIEYRVVAKAAFPARGIEDFALGRGGKYGKDLAALGQRDDADEPRAAIGASRARSSPSNLLDAFGVGCVRASVACRVHARRAAERGNDQA